MIRCTHILLFLGFFPVAAATSITEEEKQDLFSQAKQHFREANAAARSNPQKARELYQKAILRFERIVQDGGIQSGKLYYDIGNTYFRMGDLGRAILNYRRAQRYLPNDPNLAQNLQYARKRRTDQIEEKQQTKVLKTLLFWHYDLSSQARSVVFAVGFVAFWLGASVRLFARRLPPRWVLVCLGVVAVLFLGSLVFENLAERHGKAGVVLAEEVIGRKGDGESYQPAFEEPLHTGTEFRLKEDRNDWYQIELPDGRDCWLPHAAAELIW